MKRWLLGGAAGLLLAVAMIAVYQAFVDPVEEATRLPDVLDETEFDFEGNNSLKSNVYGLTELSSDAIPVMSRSSRNAEGKGMTVELGDLDALNPGDEVALYIPQEDNLYSGRLQMRETTRAGNQVLSGFLSEQGKDYRFVFTLGQYQSFGTITTPKGRYQLEAIDGDGRIVSEGNIRAGLDFSKPDYVIPVREESPSEENNDPGSS